MLVLLFLFLIGQPFIGHTGDTAALVALCGMAFISLGYKVPKISLSFIFIPSVMIGLGLIGAPGHASRKVLGDLWYYSFPSLALLTGCMLARRYRQRQSFFLVFVFAGVVLAAWQIIEVIAHRGAINDVNLLREETSNGFILTALSPLILFLSSRFGVPLIPPQKKLLIRAIYVITLIGLLLAFSRTLTIDLIAAAITGLGWITRKRHRGIVVATVLILILFELATFIPTTPNSFLGKIAGMWQEVSLTRFSNRADEIQHWRAYETFRALQTYERGDAVHKVIGMGFGQLVDIGMDVELGSTYLREIPIFHNGYVYTLIKSGYLGLILLLWYLASFYIAGARAADLRDPVLRLNGGLMMAMTTIVLSSTFVVAGWFNPVALCPVMLMMGFLAWRLWPFLNMLAAPTIRRIGVEQTVAP